VTMAGLLTGATFLAALGSRLLFVFSAFMMTARARLGAPHGIAAMQSVDVAILNPPFLSVFLGTAALSLATGVFAVAYWSAPGTPTGCWRGASSTSSASWR